MPFAVEISQALGVLIVLIGVWGVVAPARITEFVTRFTSKKGLWFAAAIRLVLGLALWFAAPASRAPLLLQVLGVIAIIAAVVIPLMGFDRFKALVEWWKELSPTAMRMWCLFAIAFGGVVLWALVPTAT